MIARPGTTGGRGRIAGLDVARGLAVLGMFAAHMRLGGDLHPDPSSWAAVVDGRSSILFATLAGVSVALLSGRSHPPEGLDLARVRLRILVRALWVFAIGWFLELLDTFVAVILGVYAVLFLLVLPFLRWPVRRLLALAAIVQATTFHDDPDVIAKVSRGLGEPMVGINVSGLPDSEKYATRGW